MYTDYQNKQRNQLLFGYISLYSTVVGSNTWNFQHLQDYNTMMSKSVILISHMMSKL